MKLVIDIGNTNTKLALFEGKDLFITSNINECSLKSIQEFVSNNKVLTAIVSSVKDIMKQSDAVISISPENWDLSTIVLESQILEKPTLNIFLNEKTYEFQCINDNSVLSMTDTSDIQHGINEILFNESTINDLKENAKKHLKSYLVNHGTASQKFANILNS